MGRFKQGLYNPKNPDKYIGDIKKIRYMSSWELSMHSFLDNNLKIIRWSSETIAVPYIKPTDNKIHRYFPDYYVEYIDKNNKMRRLIIEVKPHKQTKVSRARNTKNKVYDDIQLAVNLAKWKACTEFCNHNRLEFQIITEKQMFT
jgi:hypothetical protein